MKLLQPKKSGGDEVRSVLTPIERSHYADWLISRSKLILICSIQIRNWTLDDVDRVVANLNIKFPLAPLLQMPCLGHYTSGVSVPQFLPTADKFVQICNVSDHWVCATNLFSSRNHDVYIYIRQHLRSAQWASKSTTVVAAAYSGRER